VPFRPIPAGFLARLAVSRDPPLPVSCWSSTRPLLVVHWWSTPPVLSVCGAFPRFLPVWRAGAGLILSHCAGRWHRGAGMVGSWRRRPVAVPFVGCLGSTASLQATGMSSAAGHLFIQRRRGRRCHWVCFIFVGDGGVAATGSPARRPVPAAACLSPRRRF